jgi:anti-sigma B factor antagonist
VQLDVQRVSVAGRPVLRVVGELDLATAPRLDESADAELAAGARELVVDLTATTFMDSSGARALTRLARTTGRTGVDLLVVCPRSNRPVRLVIDLLELGSVVPVAERLPLTDVSRGDVASGDIARGDIARGDKAP